MERQLDWKALTSRLFLNQTMICCQWIPCFEHNLVHTAQADHHQSHVRPIRTSSQWFVQCNRKCAHSHAVFSLCQAADHCYCESETVFSFPHASCSVSSFREVFWRVPSEWCDCMCSYAGPFIARKAQHICETFLTIRCHLLTTQIITFMTWLPSEYDLNPTLKTMNKSRVHHK